MPPVGRKVRARTSALSVNRRSALDDQYAVFWSWTKPGTPPNPKVYPALTQPCRLWIGSGRIASIGYGTFLSRTASQWIWEYYHGPITAIDPTRTRQGKPIRQDVRHLCDNPPCVEITHLDLNTHVQNVADAHDRGRFWKGSAERMRISVRMRGDLNPARRRTPEQTAAFAAKMRAFWADPERSAALRASRAQPRGPRGPYKQRGT